MVIGICGFGYTGSGAVKDYLKEFDNIKFGKAEFNYICDTDGLVDLGQHITSPFNRTGVIYPIERYIQLYRRYQSGFCKLYGVSKKDYFKSLDEFLNSITTVEWYDYVRTGNYLRDKFVNDFFAIRLIPHLEMTLKRRVNMYPMKKVKLSGPCVDFYTAAKKHVDQLLKFMDLDPDTNIVLDQAFSANNPAVCFPFFDHVKAIVVDKDPRDLYVFSKEMLAGYGHFMPISTVEDFVNYYKSIREKQPYKAPNDNVLVINFEDLIYKYDETTDRINDFLGLDKPKELRRYFDPDVSVGNTQLFDRYTKYKEDISYIEANLKDYLYDFGRCKKVNVNTKMFV